MIDKEKARRLAAYMRERGEAEKEADALFAAEDYEEAAFLFGDRAITARRDQDYRTAHRAYCKASQAFSRLKDADRANEMQRQASSCEQYFIGEMTVESAEQAGHVAADAHRAVAGAIRDAGDANAQARIASARQLAAAIGSAIRESGTQILCGLECLSRTQRDTGARMVAALARGFGELSTAQKEGAIEQAKAILQGFGELADAAKGAALLKAYATLRGSEAISQSEKEVAQALATGFETVSEGLTARAQATLQGLGSLAEAEKMGALLRAKVDDEASKRQQAAILALAEEVAEGTRRTSGTGLKVGRMQRAAIEGHIFTEGVWKGLLHLLTLRLWRPGVVQALDKKEAP